MIEWIAEMIAEKAAEKSVKKIKELTEEAYSSGYEAGWAQCALKERKDMNIRLNEMYKFGIERGREEAKAEIEEIDDSWFEALTDMAEAEAEARQAAKQ